MAQLLMIVEIFIAQRQPVDALRQHLAHRVLDPCRVPPIPKAGRRPREQADLAVGAAQQQAASVAGHAGAIEVGYHPPRKMICKRERFLRTLCHEKGRFFFGHRLRFTPQLCLKRRPFSTVNYWWLFTTGEKFGLGQVE